MDIPQFLRRLPFIFYALAVVFFVLNIGYQWFFFSEDGGFVSATKPVHQWIMTFYIAASKAVDMLVNGAILHILISIYDKMKGAAE